MYCRLPSGNSITHCSSRRCPYCRTTGTMRPTRGWPGYTTMLQPSWWSPLGTLPALAWSRFEQVEAKGAFTLADVKEDDVAVPFGRHQSERTARQVLVRIDQHHRAPAWAVPPSLG